MVSFFARFFLLVGFHRLEKKNVKDCILGTVSKLEGSKSFCNEYHQHEKESNFGILQEKLISK